MVHACDFGQKTQRGATSCKTDFRAKRASVPDLAHVQLTLLMYMKTGRKHGARMWFWPKNTARCNIVQDGLSGKTGIGTRPCSCTANLAHVHENWAKTWCAHVVLPKKHSAVQHRARRTFGKNGHRYPTLLMYS